jgi:hypothetical protein
MGLVSVQQKQTIDWKAFFVAVLVGIIGSTGSTILSVYFAQVVLGLVISCLCVAVGIYAGLKIQRNELIQSMKATGVGQGSGRATVVIGPGQTNFQIGVERKHTEHCNAVQRDNQAQAERLGPSLADAFLHFGCPRAATDCDCWCHIT